MDSSTVTKCALCDQDKKLENSHILSKNLYKGVFYNNHRFKPITSDPDDKNVFKQDGYKEYLLCRDCENKFSRLEKVFKNTLIDIENKTSRSLSITPQVDGTLLIANADYVSIKNAILSLLWRMSISKQNFFESYRLGRYESEFKHILFNEIVIDDWIFPTIITQITIDNRPSKVIMLYKNHGRIYDKYFVWSFVAYGFLFDVIITKDKFSEDKLTSVLRSDGSLKVFSKELKTLGIDPETSFRLNDQDITDFYNL